MTYTRVLVAVDVLSDAAETVVQRALQIGSDAEITAIHVVEQHPWAGDQVAFRLLESVREQVKSGVTQRLEAVCAPAGIEGRLVLEGHAANEIRRVAESEGADLIVMGAHGRRGWRLLLGSTANAVLHGGVCDVLCVHIPEEPHPFRHLLVAVDSAEEASPMLTRAVEVAARSAARVSVVTVVQPLEYTYAGIDLTGYADPAMQFGHAVEERMQAELDELAERFGLTGERIVRRGHPAEEIHALTAELGADLVVVGTHGRHGLGVLLGSTANAVLHGAKSDILAVRMPG